MPKDSRALLRQAELAGSQLKVLKAAVASNSLRAEQTAEHARSVCGGSLENTPIALWGLAFKAGTDDSRDSPAMAVAEALARAGARCSAYDPAVPPDVHPAGVTRGDSALAVCEGAALLVVLTDWTEFAKIDLAEVARALDGNAVIDTRGVIDTTGAAEVGLRLLPVGRSLTSARDVDVLSGGAVQAEVHPAS
jgi:UDPglucose 6-dehydrogenase